MKKGIIGLLAVLLYGCSPSLKLGESQGTTRTIYLNKKESSLISSSKWFGQEAIQQIESENLIMETGEKLMEQILNGYSTQTQGLEQVYDQSEADIVINISSVEVKRGWFTFNFLFPGPMYKLIMEIEVEEKNVVSKKKRYKKIGNMAYVNFKDSKTTKWMSKEEKSKPEYQLATFEEALRGMYEKFYFEYFDISLRI